ncbi:MAG: dihydroorotate dehydrogenase electron transfer subunit [Myxococcota bacterium]|nr:dihydroorotate dehydrogenase electron transfer subunit [Myxococcota bacterium]
MDFRTTGITEILQPEPEYALLRFKGDAPIPGSPGQFVMVRGDWGTDPILPRAFSLVEVGEISAILVRVVGKATMKLAHMRVGDKLSVLGPMGRGFSLPKADRQPVLIGGGVGIAPLIFLAEQLWDQGMRPICLYGARTQKDLVLLDRLSAASQVIAVTEDGSRGKTGMVTDYLDPILTKNSPVHLYSCGPYPMLRAVAEMAATVGAPCDVALESPMACGMGTCKGCAVPRPDGGYLYVCTDGPVFDAKEIFGGAR